MYIDKEDIKNYIFEKKLIYIYIRDTILVLNYKSEHCNNINEKIVTTQILDFRLR